eukprot:2091856-Pleurochrysis_carterae.AAC.1
MAERVCGESVNAEEFFADRLYETYETTKLGRDHLHICGSKWLCVRAVDQSRAEGATAANAEGTGGGARESLLELEMSVKSEVKAPTETASEVTSESASYSEICGDKGVAGGVAQGTAGQPKKIRSGIGQKCK